VPPSLPRPAVTTVRVATDRLAAFVVPVFAVAIIVSRTLGGGLPDRLGGQRTVVVFAGAEALGLLVYALAGAPPLALSALLVLSVGQSLAVPGLGLLALTRVPAAQQGAAAGLFFAWFGAVASLAGPAGALLAAAVAVGAVVLLAAAFGSPR
jgi:MFS family permease